MLLKQQQQQQQFISYSVHRINESPNLERDTTTAVVLIWIDVISQLVAGIKGCGMGPWLVLVSPCFKENVVDTCKIGSFLCSLDNLLQKNVIVLFLETKFQNGAHLKKGLYLTYCSHFFVTREKLPKFLQHISHSHIYTYLTLFCLTNFEKNPNLSSNFTGPSHPRVFHP